MDGRWMYFDSPTGEDRWKIPANGGAEIFTLIQPTIDDGSTDGSFNATR